MGEWGEIDLVNCGDPSTYDLVRPDPAGTIQSLTSLGYTPAAAIADLIDNSIAAGARQVDVEIQWGGGDGSTIAVSDNGTGMVAEGLIRAMTIGGGGTGRDRSAIDLGRFGMGLKTASFSQAREVTVATRTNDGATWDQRTWDVDHVLRVADWQLLHNPPAAAAAVLTRILERRRGPGTVVLWGRLTQLVTAGAAVTSDRAHQEFLRQIRVIERHLAMVFARYLARRRPMVLTVNGNRLAPWDPFLSGSSWVRPLPSETPLTGVQIQGYVLPHHSRMTDAEHEEAGGPGGWLEQQGFYVYRRDRLIVAGGWLGLKGMRRNTRYQLARVAINIDTDHDQQWAIDVRKSTATPPPALIPHLNRIAHHAREQAAEVLSHKGRVMTTRRSRPMDPTWRQITKHGRSHFAINRQHPLVREALGDPGTRGQVSALLRMIEQTLPLGLILQTPDTEITAPDNGDPSPATVAMARVMLTAVLRGGDAPTHAVNRVLAMPPFDRYPTLRTMLTAADPDDPAGGESTDLSRETWSDD